jgi:hypothetical protein
MDNIVDMILKNESPSKVSDTIKDILNIKALEKIDDFQPVVATNLFNVDEDEN